MFQNPFKLQKGFETFYNKGTVVIYTKIADLSLPFRGQGATSIPFADPHPAELK